MKQPKILALLLALGTLALCMAGCATGNVNSVQPRANTGYVDLYADTATELNWDVARFDDRSQDFRNVFSELAPPPGGIVRLALAPGSHRLRITFLNRVIAKPVEVEVQVQDGKITPILVTLTAVGTAQVETREEGLGVTAKGRYGRRAKIGSDETVMYSLTAVANPSVAYQPQAQMPYAR